MNARMSRSKSDAATLRRRSSRGTGSDPTVSTRRRRRHVWWTSSWNRSSRFVSRPSRVGVRTPRRTRRRRRRRSPPATTRRLARRRDHLPGGRGRSVVPGGFDVVPGGFDVVPGGFGFIPGDSIRPRPRLSLVVASFAGASVFSERLLRRRHRQREPAALLTARGLLREVRFEIHNLGRGKRGEVVRLMESNDDEPFLPPVAARGDLGVFSRILHRGGPPSVALHLGPHLVSGTHGARTSARKDERGRDRGERGWGSVSARVLEEAATMRDGTRGERRANGKPQARGGRVGAPAGGSRA